MARRLCRNQSRSVAATALMVGIWAAPAVAAPDAYRACLMDQAMQAESPGSPTPFERQYILNYCERTRLEMEELEATEAVPPPYHHADVCLPSGAGTWCVKR